MVGTKKHKELVRGVKMYLKNMDLKGMPFKKDGGLISSYKTNLKTIMIKKKRPETMIERIERAHHMYDNGPKPKHYGDKSIVDMEEWNSMNGLQKKTPVVTKEGPFESALTKYKDPNH